MTYYVIDNDLVGGYCVSEYNKPVSEHDTRPVLEGGAGEHWIAECFDQRWAERMASLLNYADGNDHPFTDTDTARPGFQFLSQGPDKDAEFLDWVAARFVNVIGESPHVDFVQRLKNIGALLRRDGYGRITSHTATIPSEIRPGDIIGDKVIGEEE